MAKADVMKQLVEDYGYDQTELAEMNLDEMKKILESESNDDVEVDLETVEMVDDTQDYVTIDEEVSSGPVDMKDPRWNEYVMSQFVPEELYDGNPTVDGLRRVAELLIGDIVSVDTDIKQTPDLNNEKSATATVTVSFRLHGTDDYRTYSGSADAGPHNLDRVFKAFPVAMAETRAEGRALRRALRLRNIAAEEAAPKPEAENNADTNAEKAGIKDHQLTGIALLASRANVNVEKLVQSLASEGKLSNNTIGKLSEADGAALCQAISGYQGKPLPEEISGYDADWRK